MRRAVEYILSCVNILFLLGSQKYYEGDKTGQNMVILALNIFKWLEMVIYCDVIKHICNQLSVFILNKAL